MRKYTAIFAVSTRNEFAYLGTFVARNLFFVVILFIFFSLWKTVYATRSVIAGFTKAQALWYLAMTEIVELWRSGILWNIQAEIKEGSIANTLTRPYSYVVFHLSRAMGESLLKTLILLCTCTVTVTVFVGLLPGWLAAPPFGIVLIAGGFCSTRSGSAPSAFWRSGSRKRRRFTGSRAS